MKQRLKVLKALLKRFFQWAGLERSDLKLLRSISTIGIVTGFSITVSALLFPKYPGIVLTKVLGSSLETFMSALVVEEQLFSLIIGFTVLSISAIIHFLLDLYLGALDDVFAYPDRARLRMIVLAAFFLSFVTARVAVILSGIVGPETSSGFAGFLPINEVWVNGYHIHHFFFGFLALTLAGWMLLFRENFSKYLASALYGTGLGIFIDEFGMLLTEGDYFASSSYFAAITFISLLLIGVYWDTITSRKLDIEEAE